MIGRLARKGPADRAGLRGGSTRVIVGNTRLIVGGDVVVEADGLAIASSEELQRVLRGKKPGDTVRLTVVRDGKRTTLPVTLGERPAPA